MKEKRSKSPKMLEQLLEQREFGRMDNFQSPYAQLRMVWGQLIGSVDFGYQQFLQ